MIEMSRFLEALKSGEILLMDGAMGSELLRAGVRAGECLEALNLTRAPLVLAIHRAYRDAGARMLLTNTFQANRGNLKRHGLQERLVEIVRAAVGLARSVAGNDGMVLGDIGPCELDDVAEIVAGLSDVDGILLETWSTPSVLEIADRCRSLAPDVAVLISLTYRRDNNGGLTTVSGHAPEFFAAEAARAGVRALGVNCGRDIGLADTIEIIRRYRAAGTLPLLARPNAGTPERIGEDWRYPCAAEQLAEHVPGLVQAGATMIGGCCGTTPGHIAAARLALASLPHSRGLANY